MTFSIIKGDFYEEATASILANGMNQCPCVPKYAWTEDTKCICKEFKEQETEGHCRCGRYQKIKKEK